MGLHTAQAVDCREAAVYLSRRAPARRVRHYRRDDAYRKVVLKIKLHISSIDWLNAGDSGVMR